MDILRTVILAGLGALDLTDDKLRQIAGELVRRGAIAVEDAQAFAALNAARIAERERTDARDLGRLVSEELARLNVASQAAIVALDDRVTALERLLEGSRLPPRTGERR